jgi:hypothetical protein
MILYLLLLLHGDGWHTQPGGRQRTLAIFQPLMILLAAKPVKVNIAIMYPPPHQ